MSADMEHVVFVPVPSQSLRAALADPAQVAGAVPGLQQDAGTEPVAGRLKLRIGSHSITYRGALSVLAHEDGVYAVEGDATESRGTGSVKLALTIRVAESDDGSTLTYGGTASASGRVTELPPDAVRAAVTRLLDRFAENLAAGTAELTDGAKTDGVETGGAGGAGGAETGGAQTGAADTGKSAEPGETAETAEPGEPTETAETTEPAESLATEDFAPLSTGDFEATPDADDAPAPPPGEAATEPSEHTSVFDVEVPPSPLDPLADEDDGDDKDEDKDDEGVADDVDDAEGMDDEDVDDADDVGPGAAGPVPEDYPEAGEPPAEAAHARRTMIGRSAEEVDHAPPRGRYAPVPAPLTVSASPTLRWAVPTAALAVAGAIVVSRALRRRR